ncbi:MAG TPA: hypothetical protein VGV69_00405 [Solirubrobacterales bacterium]|nr:hypothetical protein [Solirubrobacterales bacterium]
MLAALCAAALLAFPATGAAAFKTTVVVSLKFPAFHGKLKSPRAACVEDRQVKLFRVRSGPDKLLGTDKSEDNGAWSIPIGRRLTSGGYYAKAVARGNCRAGKSKVNYVD